MSRKTLNVIIGIVVSFIVIFFAGSSAYKDYKMRMSDSQYESSLEEDMDETSKENASGPTNEESKNQ